MGNEVGRVPWWWLPLAVIDLETTGVRSSDRIVQIGVVSVDRGEITGTWESVVNPRRGVPVASTKIHGITDSMARGAPSLDDLKPELEEILRGRIPVGYNGNKFDRRRLQGEWGDPPDKCPALDPEWPWIDPLIWERRIGGKRKEGYTLTTVAKRRGIEIEGRAHSALTDALITFDLLPVMIHNAPRFLPELLRAQASR